MLPPIKIDRLTRLLVICCFLAVPSTQAAPKEVVLKNAVWTVSIDPSSLQTTARPAGRTAVQISAGQKGLGPITHLKQTAPQASWELANGRVTVSARLEKDALEIEFVSRTVGGFTWPVIERQPVIRGYILPTFEGVYVPANDPEWSAFLAEQGEPSTTEGLSLPLWGLDCGGYTLTYLLTHPFNNALTFQNAGGNLSARLTHQFTRNWKVKRYGLRISLGASSPIEPARQYRRWLIQQGQFVSLKEKIRHTPEAAKLLGAAHVYLWGDGVSPAMMATLAADGFDRLWLGVDGWPALRRSPETIRKAKALGYLIAPYDSYNSIHSPDANPDDTWETAQFDRELYETGPVVRWDGRKKPGFAGKGYLLSPLVAQPYVEKRVSGLMREIPCNSWFIDCDAFGELFDDYSRLHPATQEDDMKARLRRMAWIRDTYGLVIGSEGGSAYAASTIHFAHGMMTPVIGFGDPDLNNPQSPYFLGRYWPGDAPAVFFKQVPLKPRYYRFYFDPRFRLPLYETVFHDSLVATHHWSSPSLKYKDQIVEQALLELLYMVPPLYHLNQKEFAQQEARLRAHYAFFSPLHREAGLLPLTDFAWLTADRSVQRTMFGRKIELVANFGPRSFKYRGIILPRQSILAFKPETGQSRIYTPLGVAGSAASPPDVGLHGPLVHVTPLLDRPGAQLVDQLH